MGIRALDELLRLLQGYSVFIVCAVLYKKVRNVLSHCHTNRRMGVHGHAHPCFDMTPTFQKKKSQIYFPRKNKSQNLKKRKRKKSKMSFGMTTTQDITDLCVHSVAQYPFSTHPHVFSIIPSLFQAV